MPFISCLVIATTPSFLPSTGMCLPERNAHPANSICFGLPDSIKEANKSYYYHAEDGEKRRGATVGDKKGE